MRSLSLGAQRPALHDELPGPARAVALAASVAWSLRNSRPPASPRSVWGPSRASSPRAPWPRTRSSLLLLRRGKVVIRLSMRLIVVPKKNPGPLHLQPLRTLCEDRSSPVSRIFSKDKDPRSHTGIAQISAPDGAAIVPGGQGLSAASAISYSTSDESSNNIRDIFFV